MISIDKKSLLVSIEDKTLIEKLQELGGLLYNENKLTLLEAAYFAERGVLDLNKDDLLKMQKKKDKLAEDKYAVIKNLRDNGYIVRMSLDDSEYFRVYQKGFRPNEDRTKYILRVVPKNWKTDIKDMEESIDFANKLRKELVFAYVDGAEKTEIRFIKINRTVFQ